MRPTEAGKERLNLVAQAQRAMQQMMVDAEVSQLLPPRSGLNLDRLNTLNDHLTLRIYCGSFSFFRTELTPTEYVHMHSIQRSCVGVNTVASTSTRVAICLASKRLPSSTDTHHRSTRYLILSGSSGRSPWLTCWSGSYVSGVQSYRESDSSS
jgi:hypothetical protein